MGAALVSLAVFRKTHNLLYLALTPSGPAGDAQAKKEMNDMKNPVVAVLGAVESVGKC